MCNLLGDAPGQIVRLADRFEMSGAFIYTTYTFYDLVIVCLIGTGNSDVRPATALPIEEVERVDLRIPSYAPTYYTANDFRYPYLYLHLNYVATHNDE